MVWAAWLSAPSLDPMGYGMTYGSIKLGSLGLVVLDCGLDSVLGQ